MSLKQMQENGAITPIREGTMIIVLGIPELFGPKEICTVADLNLLTFFVINERGVGCWFQRGDRRIEVIK